MDNKQVAIVIPLYMSCLNDNEVASFLQCYKILGDFPIILIAPEGLDTDYYKRLLHNEHFTLIRFSADNFSNVDAYSNMLRSATFYEKFVSYTYILIYQLDAFVFKNELPEWVAKGYDYIGAPWFKGWYHPDKNNEIIGVGNGGFSLRRVDSFIKIIRRYARINSFRHFWRRSGLDFVFPFHLMLPAVKAKLKISHVENVDNAFFEFKGNEDFFWGLQAPAVFADFNVAPIADAIRFSFEVNPSLLFQMNKGQLPFGCHAWEKYEPEFWEKYIPVQHV